MTTNYELRFNEVYNFTVNPAYQITDFSHLRMITSEEKKKMLELKESI
eukprot:CAMPEP_0116924638 /NCGR_PEP_ID=MMETSP0467-20121206/23634_1 /TAXON_ID=283647 /ORGANISM="Mesodinium pulex, Strain SPMC105" /LENGTH=47 /DNA_ID= /DNA_START= /DNA_END= /DNA_ORIENTATION=